MNTLQKILQKFFGFGLYGLVRLKKGIRLSTTITFRCNYKCKYCNMTIPSGGWLKSKENSVMDWVDFIERFPLKVKEVNISGGEPTLLIATLIGYINTLLNKGYFVTLYTNLSNPKLLELVNPSFRFRILTTYHHTANKEKFEAAYKKLSKKYRVDVDEIGEGLLKNSKVKSFDAIDSLRYPKYRRLRVAPDLRIFTDCYSMYNCNAYKT